MEKVERGAVLRDVLPAALAGYAWFHASIAVSCLFWVALRFRATLLPQPGAGARTSSRFHPRRGTARWNLPPVGDWPLIWKERFIEGAGRRGALGWLRSGFLLALLFWPPLHLFYFFGRFHAGSDAADRFGELLNYWVRAVTLLLSTWMFLKIAIRSAGGVCGERERRTLDLLMTTPVETKSFLVAKWLGGLHAALGTARWLAAVWLVGLLTGALHPAALPRLVIACGLIACVVASAGLWASIGLRRSRLAILFTLMAVARMALSCASQVPAES